MKESLFNHFVELYTVFKTTDSYSERVDQFAVTAVFREIIIETLKNTQLTNEHLTGLIQMFKFGCTREIFDKYLKQNIQDPSRVDEISAMDLEINQTGYTRAGLNSINGLNSTQLTTIKKMLQDAFQVASIEAATSLCEDFDNMNIPYVKSGIYSPWLYYINPQIFPILNNEHKEFRKWIEMPADYPSCIRDFNQLKTLVGESELGVLDAFAYRFTEYSNLPEGVRVLNLNGKRLFKLSHGIFTKSIHNRNNGLPEILEKNNWITIGKETGKNQAKHFVEKASIGDYVYVCYGGDELYCIARISSEAMPLDKETEQLIEGGYESIYREIEPLYFPNTKPFVNLKNDTRGFMPSGNTTFYEVPKKEIESINQSIFVPNCNLLIIDKMNDISNHTTLLNDDSLEQTSYPLNTILYGPPGTGKTYNSISKAVAIIEEATIESIQNEERSEVKQRFEKYVKEGRIVFCTFHQSMGYEDFIEGIKPIAPTSEDGELTYEVEDGIFKRLCTEASFSYIKKDTQSASVKVLDFSDNYDNYVDWINDELSQHPNGITIKTKNEGDVIIDSISPKNNILLKHQNSDRLYIVSKKRLSKISQEVPNLSTISNISDTFRSIIGGCNASLYWAVLNDLRQKINQITVQITVQPTFKDYSYEDKKTTIESLTNDDFNQPTSKKFVLIIDEINRGNVSQVFGELITLIEDDKRLGNNEALKATLPYSKEIFGVPNNLHIIGTMNTADRSVEALDSALRRRFWFEYMKPQPQRLNTTEDGIELQKILENINARLTVLKDADHTIGHAWLWSVKNIDDLKMVFANKIIPLLQEYFYNDYEKLGLVLGDPFFKQHVQVSSTMFAQFSGSNGLAGQYDQSWQYELKPVSELTMADFKSLENQYSQVVSDEE